MTRPTSSPAQVWTWPIAIALFTASGLVSALLSDAWGDAWSWLGLGLPVVVIAVCALRRRVPARH